MRYSGEKTSIPVPLVLHWRWDLSLSWDTSSMTPACTTCSYFQSVQLRKGEGTLKTLYGELAGVLLQLSKPSFSRIGSPSQVGELTWEVTSCALSIDSNELVRVGSLPQSKLPSPETPFTTASSYFEAIAEIYIAHLTHQRNDAIESADDCRRKFVARYLFRKLARGRKLTQRWIAFDKGPFKIWCDDLRPTNVLLNKVLKIAGVVDWEFTYTAPIEFTYAPPWWLLIERLEYWPQGLDDWTDMFDRRFQTFLQAMIDCENATSVKEEERLSGPMRESWESCDFWIVYAARKSNAFDSTYWNKIDQRFFGQTDNVEDAWRERLDLLSGEEKDEMEKLVAEKTLRRFMPRKKAKKVKEGKEQEEGKEDDHKSEENKAEVDAIDGKPIDTEVEQMAGKLAELAA
ncbi:hypothetical protein PENFLA_c017G02512 [Penicillium flavigenum]|uniref:Aminoglycoside phosphotransferase domain-containing protein n=1 Tax=Penicillium flavigenum TaxID=254877 RepID=A0A1V6T2T6_9EURO|nr:hypothetical protein PENFLA_c017G02512 [Penicillium flavigenum]